MTLNNAVSVVEVDAPKTLTLGGTATGTGTLNKTGLGTLENLGGFNGTVNIAAGTVKISTANFGNALTGTATLAVERTNATDSFSFDNTVGTAFAGTVGMMRGTVNLDDSDNYAVLQNATLRLDTDSTATVTQDRTIKGLTLSGGTLKFDVTTITPNGILSVTELNATGGGTIMMDVNKPIDTSLFTTENWYDYGNSGSAKQYQLVAATNVTGAGTQLDWKDYQGNNLGSQARTINNGTENIGTATFGYAGTIDNTGIHVGYTLTQLSADAGKTVTLDSTGTTGTVLNAKLTGSGGFTFIGDQETYVGNTASDYTGETTVDTQTVTVLTNNAFGQTSSLNLRNNGTIVMDGKSQTVGRLEGEAGTQITLGTLTETGPGSLTLTGGVLTLSGTNSTYTGGTTISGGTVVAQNATALGTGGVTIGTGGTLETTTDVTVASLAANDATINLGTLGRLLTVIGNASFTNTTVSIDAASATAGTYTLIGYDTLGTNDVTVVAANLVSNRGGQFFADSALKYEIIDGPASLAWTGSSSEWNTENTNDNWSTGNFDTWFKNGDSVTFGDVSNKIVTIDPNGVSVGSMSVSATGYTFNLTAGNTPGIMASGSVDLGNSTLNITGYTPGNDHETNVQTVITTSTGISNFNPAVTVAGQANADFLSASAFLDGNGNDVIVETRLTWYSTDPNREAHGDFTVDGGDTFTLGAVLADNDASTNRRADWDGKSLTKKGEGTLIVNGTNTATGTLYHDEGDLMLNSLWSGNYEQKSTAGIFASDDAMITGNATFRSAVTPTGTLTIGGDAAFDGATVDFGLLKDENKIVVGGHADIANVTAKLDVTGAGSGRYTVAEYGSKTLYDVPDVEITGLGDNRGDFYVNAAVDDTALIYDLLVGNAKLYWYGSEGNTTWNDDKTNKIWTDNYILTWHRSGDDVEFSDKAPTRRVDVASAVTANTLTVSASGYVFNVDLDAGGIISAANFTNTGEATIIATKNVDADLNKGEENKTLFTVLDGAGADAFAASFSTTNSRIRSAPFSDADTLGFWLWLQYAYRDDYGRHLSPNGDRTAGLIDDLPSGNGFLARLDALSDDASVISGLENATGEGYAMSMQGVTNLQRTFDEFLLARKILKGGDQHRVMLGQCNPRGPVCGSRSSYELRGQFIGGSHDRSSVGRYSGYDLSNYGVAFGIERKISSRWFGGVAFGYDHANLKLDDRAAKDEFEAFRASLYGGYAGRSWYASGYAGYSKNRHDMKRNNYSLGFNNRGKYDDDVFSTGLELGKVLKLHNGAQFIPSIGIHWIHLDNPAFTERGDVDSAFSVSKSCYDSVRLPIGVRLNKTFESRMIAWTPEVRAFYIAELSDTRSGLHTAFASSVGSGSVFADSGNGGRSGGMFGTGVTAQLSQRLSVTVDYDYEVWEHYDRHNLTGNVTYRW